MDNEIKDIKATEKKIKFANDPQAQLKKVKASIENVYKQLKGKYNAELYSKLNSLKADVKRLQTEIENKTVSLPYKNNICLRDYIN